MLNGFSNHTFHQTEVAEFDTAQEFWSVMPSTELLAELSDKGRLVPMDAIPCKPCWCTKFTTKEIKKDHAFITRKYKAKLTCISYKMFDKKS